MYDITWFPLDVERPSTQQVIEFCSANGVDLVWDGLDRLHTSSPGKLEFFDKLKSLMSNGNTNLWKILSRDIDLYRRVVTKI